MTRQSFRLVTRLWLSLPKQVFQPRARIHESLYMIVGGFRKKLRRLWKNRMKKFRVNGFPKTQFAKGHFSMSEVCKQVARS